MSHDSTMRADEEQPVNSTPHPHSFEEPDHTPSSHSHDHDHDHAQGGRGGVAGWVRELFHPHSHDATDSLDSALEGSAEGIRAVKISLVVLLVTACAQAAIVALTGSVALLADTIHNFSDALTALPLWVAFVLGRRRPTRSYTYGYGRAEDLAGLFIIAMIAASAIVAGYQSIARLVDPHPVEHPWVLVAAGVIGFAGNELVAIYRIRVGNQIGSAALVADGQHARTDGFTSLAVVGGAAGVLLGFPLADPLVGLAITIAILMVLRSATTDIYRRLMDAVDPTLTDTALATLAAMPGVIGVDEVQLRWTGHRLRGEARISVAHDLHLTDAHAIAHDAEDGLVAAVPKLDTVTVHVSPTAPQPLLAAEPERLP